MEIHCSLASRVAHHHGACAQVTVVGPWCFLLAVWTARSQRERLEKRKKQEALAKEAAALETSKVHHSSDLVVPKGITEMAQNPHTARLGIRPSTASDSLF